MVRPDGEFRAEDHGFINRDHRDQEYEPPQTLQHQEEDKRSGAARSKGKHGDSDRSGIVTQTKQKKRPKEVDKADLLQGVEGATMTGARYDDTPDAYDREHRTDNLNILHDNDMIYDRTHLDDGVNKKHAPKDLRKMSKMEDTHRPSGFPSQRMSRETRPRSSRGSGRDSKEDTDSRRRGYW